MRFALIAVTLFGCGFQPGGGRSSGSNGSMLGGTPDGKEEPGDPSAGAGNAGTTDCGQLKDELVNCQAAGNLECTPIEKELDGCFAAANPPPGDEICKQLEEKVAYCKENNLDCPEAIKELGFCSTSPSPVPNQCESLAGLYKSCVTSHPGDALCDEILAVWEECEAGPGMK